MDSILRIENVSKTYTGHKALDDVSMEIPRGSIYGLLGPNGAGKTTLIRVVNHMTLPDCGKVWFQDHEITADDIYQIGYMPEERGLYKKMKVGEQAVFFARMRGMSKFNATRKLHQWFDRLGLSEWWDKKVEDLSKGMAQKVQFITTVVHEPKLLIFDEPFSGFDPINANLLKEEILGLRDRGATVIFSTHNMESVEEICDDITLINKSRNILSGPVDEIRRKDAEIIRLAMDILRANNIDGLRLNINSIGCPNCRTAYLEKLREYLAPTLPTLCKTCQERFERNPMRILDCKEDADKLTDAPAMLDNLCEDCATHFEKLKSYLKALGIEYAIDPRIVRGLDYYTKTVFEIITDTPDGALTVCGGGRYDGLVEELGGPATPGIGWGMGIERMIMVQDMRGVAPDAPAPLEALVVTLGDEARMEGVKLVSELRAAGVRADLDHAARSMKAQFKYAGKLNVKKVVVIAGDELAKGVVKVRDMEKSEETEVERDRIVALLAK